jgi:hypothetical protein
LNRSIEFGFGGGTVRQIRALMVRNGFGLWCTHHVLNGEPFHRDQVVIIYELSAQLMNRVPALIGNPPVESRYVFCLDLVAI